MSSSTQLRRTAELDAADLDALRSLELEEALERLATVDERLVEAYELRSIVGLDSTEAASALGIPAPVVERLWQAAKAWLRREMG